MIGYAIGRSDRKNKQQRSNTIAASRPMTLLFSFVLIAMAPLFVQGQGFSGCTPLANETWAGLVQAISDSYIIAVLCPFQLSGDGCPSPEEYPDGIVFGPGNNEIMIVECDDITDRFGADDTYTQCVIDCPGRHFTVASSPPGLILTNLVLSGATSSSVLVEAGSGLEVVNTIFYNNSAGVHDGGAITVQGDSTIDIEFSTFRENRGVIGGALHIDSSSASVRQSIFLRNEANAAGGAIAIRGTSDVDIQYSSFTGNEASDGGALYLAEYGDLTISRTDLKENLSHIGGAIFSEGVLSVTESTFSDNTGVDGGGAINCEVGSSTVLVRSTFVNNESGGYGPAVYDRYNSGVLLEGNTACGNLVKIERRVPISRYIQCEGVYALAGRRRTRRCQPFQNECVAPTDAPTLSPMPSFLPSSKPSRTATEFPSTETSLSPTTMPSFSPSEQPTHTPTGKPTMSLSSPPSQSRSDFASTEPSFLPTSIPSDGPSLSPTHSITGMPSYGPSFIPSDAPSLIPSDAPSYLPSGEPSYASRW